MSTPAASLDHQVEDLVAALCAEHDIPGAAVGVWTEGREIVACHGVTSVDDPLPVTDQTLFFIGSTSKTVTATALVALVEAGLVSLDDPVTEHLPDLKLTDAEALARLTVGHLVDHTAGWVGDVSIDHRGPTALADAVAEITATAVQLTPPGEVMSYNNAAFVMLGHLIEVLTGEPYESAIRRLVLEPLGMHQTWSTAEEVALRRLAAGHVAKDGEMTVVPDWPVDRSILPAGGLISSVHDQLRYARFHLDGGPALSDAARLAMREQRVRVRSSITGVGTSWLLNRYGSTELVEHGGNLDNLYLSSFSLAPGAGLAVTTLANSVGGRKLGTAVLDHVLRAAGATPAPAPEGRPLPPTWRADYAGRYDAGLWSLTIDADDDGRLTVEQRLHDLDPPIAPEVRATFDLPPTPLVLVDEDVVAPADDPTSPNGDFVRDEAGVVRFLRHGLRLCRKVADTD